MILVLNCGSQSIKWKLFNKKLKVLEEKKIEILNTGDYEKVLGEEILKLKDFEIDLIGHRVVHGGGKFSEPIKINNRNLSELEELSYLAPLHNPYNILGIKMCGKFFNKALQCAVFDTEFFKTVPEKAFTYALPEKVNREYKFRRYGFHGISHEYVASAAAKAMADKEKGAGKKLKNLKIISCHLGGGSSVTAIKKGKAVDTSMGFSPLSGVVMMTRPGDLDDEIIFSLTEKLGVRKTREIWNKESGLKGVCGANNMLELFEMIKAGDAKAKLAFDIFVYSIKKYIGSYVAVLGGCDMLVFTGSVGVGVSKTRNAIINKMDILKNTKVLAIKTNEELAIAEKILNL